MSNAQSTEALDEVLRAVEAWDKGEPFGLDTDEEKWFKDDADFICYIGKVAEQGIGAQ